MGIRWDDVHDIEEKRHTHALEHQPPVPELAERIVAVRFNVGLLGYDDAKSRAFLVNKMDEKILASPAMAGGTWYFRTHGHLMAAGT